MKRKSEKVVDIPRSLQNIESLLTSSQLLQPHRQTSPSTSTWLSTETHSFGVYHLYRVPDSACDKSPPRLNNFLPPFWFALRNHTSASMDIALELCDTYFFDYLYSAILPAQSAVYTSSKDGLNNTTSLHSRQPSSWQFEPATQFISFPPGEAAYTSQWMRDNIYRQFLSLVLVTWYVLTSYECAFKTTQLTPSATGSPEQQFTF